MDIHELRFRILFEYYNELRFPSEEDTDTAWHRVRKMDVPKHEKIFARIWLIESNLVSGHVMTYGRQHVPNIGKINNHGIDLVESVMNDV